MKSIFSDKNFSPIVSKVLKKYLPLPKAAAAAAAILAASAGNKNQAKACSTVYNAQKSW
jgi:hypothetical protein